jgi:hypothetical protein
LSAMPCVRRSTTVRKPSGELKPLRR